MIWIFTTYINKTVEYLVDPMSAFPPLLMCTLHLVLLFLFCILKWSLHLWEAEPTNTNFASCFFFSSFFFIGSWETCVEYTWDTHLCLHAGLLVAVTWLTCRCAPLCSVHCSVVAVQIVVLVFSGLTWWFHGGMR